MLVSEFQLYLGNAAPGPFKISGSGSMALFGLGVLNVNTPAAFIQASGQMTLTGTGVLDVGTPPAELPCPALGVRRVITHAVRQSDPARGPLWQEPAGEIDRIDVDIDYANLTDTEEAELAAVEDSGLGLVKPFQFELDGVTRLYLFAEDTFQTGKRNAGPTNSARRRLIDVTPSGWTP